ncbi:MAG: ATP-binding protein [Pseudomonadota bacterium]
MSGRFPLAPLTPAVLAGACGGLAYVVGAEPLVTVGAAVVGAALGAIGWKADEESSGPAAPPPPPALKAGLSDTSAIIDALPFGVLIVDERRLLKQVNPAAMELFGIGDVVGENIAVLRSRRLLEGIDEVVQGEPVLTTPFQVPRISDSALTAHIERAGSDGDILVAIADETQMRRTLATHRDFIANASHELKTPLASVSGIIDTLLGPAREDVAARERFLNMLVGQTERMTRLVEDLLSLNRIELNERVAPDTPEDVLNIVGEVVDALRPMAEVAGVSLTFTHNQSGIIVHADRDELERLFQNLIDNGIKYGGSGKTVTISVLDPDSPGPDMVGISVRDQGAGIERADVPRLTERFYRANTKLAREKAGTGLGLAISELIVNRHRGLMTISSELGDGAEFTVWLPVVSRVAPDLRSSDRHTASDVKIAPESTVI